MTGYAKDDPSAALAPPAPRAAAAPYPRDRRSRRMFGRRRTARRAASGGLRNLALLELLYGSGLRATELVGLPRGAIRPGQPFLMVRGKGSGSGWCRFPRGREDAVSKWLEMRRATSWLFPSGRSHLSRVRLFQIVRAIAADAGIAPERVSPHVLRHAFATHLLVGRCGLARAPVPARPCRHRDDANLYPCRQRAAGRAGQHPPPTRDRRR